MTRSMSLSLLWVHRQVRLTALLCVALMMFTGLTVLSGFKAHAAPGDELTWVGSGGGGDGVTWDDAENWSPVGVPGADAVVHFTTNATVGGAGTFDVSMLTVTGAGVRVTVNANVTATSETMGLLLFPGAHLTMTGTNGANNLYNFTAPGSYLTFDGEASTITNPAAPGRIAVNDDISAPPEYVAAFGNNYGAFPNVISRPTATPADFSAEAGHVSFTGACGFSFSNSEPVLAGYATFLPAQNALWTNADRPDPDGYIPNTGYRDTEYSYTGHRGILIFASDDKGSAFNGDIWVTDPLDGSLTPDAIAAGWASAHAAGSHRTTVDVVEGRDRALVYFKVGCRPEAPVNVAVSRAVDRATVSWEAPATSVASTRNITGYQILRSDDGGANFQVATSVYHTVRSFTHQSLTLSNAYAFKVRAIAQGSMFTTPGVASTAATSPGLAAPTQLAATTTAHSVKLTWTASTVPTGLTLTGYRICRTPDGACSTTATTATTYTDSSVTTSTEYRYTVAAVVTGNAVGPATAAVTASPGALGAPKVRLAAGATAVTVSWTPGAGVSADGYVVYRRVNKSPVTTADIIACLPADTDPLSYADTDVADGGTFYYAVAAFSGACADGAAERDYGTPSKLAAATLGIDGPGGLSAASSDGAVQLAWSAPAATDTITGYLIYRSTNGDLAAPPSTPVAYLPAVLGTSYADYDAATREGGRPKGLTNGTEYFYWVRATVDPAAPSAVTVNDTSGAAAMAAIGAIGAPSSKVSATPAPGQGLGLSMKPATTPVPGAEVDLEFQPINALLDTTINGPLTASLTFPKTDLQTLTVVGTSGEDWTCDGTGVSLGEMTLVTCANQREIAPSRTGTYPKLVVTVKVPEDAAYGNNPIDYSMATETLTVSSASPLMLPISPLKTAHLGLSVGPPTALHVPSGADGEPQSEDWQQASVTVNNDGNGDTLSEVSVAVRIPAGVTAGEFTPEEGWTCSGSTTLTCVSRAPLPAGSQQPLLQIPVVAEAKPEGSDPYLFAATATSTDGRGQISTSASGSVAAPLAPEPIIEPSSTKIDLASLVDPGRTRLDQRPTWPSDTIIAPLAQSAIVRLGVVNHGQGAADGTVRLVLALPARTEASLLTGSAGTWTCAQETSTLTCTAVEQKIAVGADLQGPKIVVSPVTDAPIVAPAAFQGSLYTLYTPADGDLDDSAQSAPALVDLSTPGGTASPDVTTRASVADTPLTSNLPSSVTFSLVGPTGTSPATKRTFALLAPPQVTLDADSIAVVDAASTQDPTTTASGDRLVAYPEDVTSLYTCRAVAPGAAGTFPGGASQAIVCTGNSAVPARSRVDVTVDFTAGPSISGPVTFTVGTLDALGEAASQTKLRESGATALGASYRLVARGVALRANAGKSQTVATTVPDSAGILRATRVVLDASASAKIGRPLTYAWVQTAGPNVRWADPAPSSTTPRVPEVDATGTQIPAPHAVGEGPAFSAPYVTEVMALTFTLYVTDGYATATATTTVTLTPVADTAPVIDDTDISLTADGTPVDSGTAPAAGSKVVMTVPFRDVDLDSVALNAAVVTPSELPALAFTIVDGTTDSATASGTATVSFTWPVGVSGLLLRLDATDGHVDPEGLAIAGHANVGIGAALAPLTQTLLAADGGGHPLDGTVVAGTTVTITNTVGNPTSGGLTTKVTWSQVEGPAATITPASDGRSATVAVPLSAQAGDVLTVRAIARRGSGTMSDVTTTTSRLVVRATAPLALDPLEIPDELTLHEPVDVAATVTGGVAPYLYEWSMISGPDEVTAIDDPQGAYTGHTSATVSDTSVPGPETLQLVVTDAVGTSTVQTGILTVPGPNPSQVACGTGLPGGAQTALGTLFGAAANKPSTDQIVFTYGDAIFDLGTVGAVIGSTTCSADVSLTITNATMTYQGIGLTKVSGTVTKTGFTITSATVLVPSSWGLGIITATGLTYDWSTEALSGVLTATALPLVAKASVVSNPITTLTFSPDLLTVASSAKLLSPTGTLSSGTVAISGAYCLADEGCDDVNAQVGDVEAGELAGSVKVTGLPFLNGTAAGSGVLRRDSDGEFDGEVHLAWSGSGAVFGPVAVEALALDWDQDGISFAAEGTVSSGQARVAVTLDGSYSDSTHWSATATGGLARDWTPAPGLTLAAWNGSVGEGAVGGYLTGTVANAGKGITTALALHAPDRWSVGALSIGGLSVEIGAGSAAPAACKLTKDQQGAPYLRVAGNAAVALASTTVGMNAEVCVVPGVSWRTVVSSTAAGSPVQVASGITLSGIQLAASHTAEGETSVLLTGRGSAYGATGGATVAIEKSGGDTDVVAVLTVDLSTITNVLKGQGSLVYSTSKIDDLAEYSDLNLGFASEAPEVVPSCGSGTPTVNGVEVEAGFTVLGSFSLSRGACDFLSDKLGFVPGGTVLASAHLGGGAATVTLGLRTPTGGITLFRTDDGTSLALNGAELAVSTSGTFSISADGTLRMPVPDDTSNDPEMTELDLEAGLQIDLTALSVTASLSMAGVDGGSWDNAFGITDLDIASLDFAAGISFASPLPVPTIGIAATVVDLPGDIKRTLGIQTGSGGRMVEAVSFALNISTAHPIVAISLGEADGQTFIKPLTAIVPEYADELAIDVASLVIAPSGGDIGNTHFDPGFSLRFDAIVVGTAVHVDASFDPTAGSLRADASVGAFSAGPIALSDTEVHLEVSPEVGLDFSFTGGFTWGSVTAIDPTTRLKKRTPSSVQATVAVKAGPDQPLNLHFEAALKEYALYPGITLSTLNLYADAALGSLEESENHVTLAAGAETSVLGHPVIVAGSLAINSNGIDSFALVAATTPIEVLGTTVSGTGCDPTLIEAIPAAVLKDITIPTTGPCIQFAYGSGGAQGRITGSIETPVGLAATIDASITKSGLTITKGEVEVADAVTVSISNSTFVWGASYTLYVPYLGLNLPATSGDFHLNASAAVDLAGFQGNMRVSIGHVGERVWGSGSLSLGVLSASTSPVRASVTLQGDFSARNTPAGERVFDWSLAGDAYATLVAGTAGTFKFANAHFALDSDGNLAVSGALAIGNGFSTPSIAADVSADLDMTNGIRFSFNGTAAAKLLGTTVAATVSVTNRTPTGAVEAGLAMNASLGGILTVQGSAIIASNGGFCMDGRADVGSGIVSAAALVCTAGVSGHQPGVVATLNIFDLLSVGLNFTDVTHYVIWGSLQFPNLGFDAQWCGLGCWGAKASFSGGIFVSFSSHRQQVTVSPGKVVTVGAGVSVQANASVWAEVCAGGCIDGSLGVSIHFNPTKFCADLLGMNFCYRPPASFS